VIYLDTSVALAHLFAEDRAPAPSLWAESLVSSRLLEFELWTRVNARKLGSSHAAQIGDLMARIAFLELARPVLIRALEPFPTPVRTLDALHLASMDFLRSQGQRVELATYDTRLAAAARKMGIPLKNV